MAVIERVEKAHVDFLRAQLTDYNKLNRKGQWIFPDRPLLDVIKNQTTSYPRVGVTRVSQLDEILGMSSIDNLSTVVIEYFVVCAKDKPYSVSGTNMSGDRLADQITGEIVSAYRQNWYDDANLSNSEQPLYLDNAKDYSLEKGLSWNVLTIEHTGFNLGSS